MVRDMLLITEHSPLCTYNELLLVVQDSIKLTEMSLYWTYSQLRGKSTKFVQYCTPRDTLLVNQSTLIQTSLFH